MDSVYKLIELAQKGDVAAKEQLIKENSGLIWSIVKRFYGRGEQEDLYQIGAIGLLKCIDKFDFSYGVKFSTYAVPMIAGEIKRFLRDDGTIKVSRNLKELSFRVKTLQEQFIKEGKEEPSVTVLADYLQVTVEELILALESDQMVESLQQPKGEKENSQQWIDKLYDTNENEKTIEQITLKETISQLEQKERKLILMRYFQDKTQMDVARSLGISQVQVSRLEKKILTKMKNQLQ